MTDRSPFDWRGQPSIISMKDVDSANKRSYQQTSVVNRARAKGVEPSKAYSFTHEGAQPQSMVMDMPVMPLHRKRKRRG